MTDVSIQGGMVQTPGSSCIESVGHNGTTGDMVVVFRKGGRYVFSGVPADVYREMISSPSVGKYFHSRIEGHFPYRKVK